MMTMIRRNRINTPNHTKQPQDEYYSLSSEDFTNLIRAFEQVFGMLCFRESKHFRHAHSVEPANFSLLDKYQALVHMVETANADENDEGINALRALMVSYLGPLDQIIAVKLMGRHCYVIPPKYWMDRDCAH